MIQKAVMPTVVQKHSSNFEVLACLSIIEQPQARMLKSTCLISLIKKQGCNKIQPPSFTNWGAVDSPYLSKLNYFVDMGTLLPRGTDKPKPKSHTIENSAASLLPVFSKHLNKTHFCLQPNQPLSCSQLCCPLFILMSVDVRGTITKFCFVLAASAFQTLKTTSHCIYADDIKDY